MTGVGKKPKTDKNQDESEEESEPTITPTLKIDITEDILLHPEASLFLPEESENDDPSDDGLSEIHENDILDKEHLKYHSHRIHEAGTLDVNESGEDFHTKSDDITKEENVSDEKSPRETPETKKANCSKVELTMESKIVENEWIILFKKYYDKGTI